MNPGTRPAENPAAPEIPRLGYAALFFKFLKFGCLAWGGPVAQIAMIQRELVEEERWISLPRFHRALAVYQVLPGPEAHELCVYFGMLARGRPGAVLAGLGFMLPGFLLMFLLSWVYVRYGIASPRAATAFAAVQAAVLALIARAAHRIGRHAIDRGWHGAIALAAAAAQVAGVHFAFSLAFAGGTFALLRRRRYVTAGLWAAVVGGAGAAWILLHPAAAAGVLQDPAVGREASLPAILLSGLAAGLLTFGGAYTAIPYVQRDAVTAGGWLTNREFLDGLALSGILPAPLIIFTTFVGYVAGGPWGAVLMTAGVFLPAFGFTLLGHEFLERVTERPAVHDFLQGVMIGVVGLIAASALGLMRAGITSWRGALLFGISLAILYLWKGKAAVPTVILLSAGAGLWLDVR